MGQRHIKELVGVGYTLPLSLSVFSLAALGLIGIPGTMGFMSKFYFANALIEVNQPLGFSILLISSFLNAVYFFPIIINGFLKENKQHDKDMHKDPLPLTMRISLVSLLIINVALGFFPNILKSIIDVAITSFIR